MLTEDWDRSANEWAIARDGNTVALLAEDAGRVNLYQVDLAAAGAQVRRGETVKPTLLVRGGHLTAPAWLGGDGLGVHPRLALDAARSVDPAPRRGGARTADAFQRRAPPRAELGEVREIEFPGAGGRRCRCSWSRRPGSFGTEAAAHPSRARRPPRHLRPPVPFPLECAALRRPGLCRGDGELPRLDLLRAGVRGLDPRLAWGSAVRRHHGSRPTVSSTRGPSTSSRMAAAGGSTAATLELDRGTRISSPAW